MLCGMEGIVSNKPYFLLWAAAVFGLLSGISIIGLFVNANEWGPAAFQSIGLFLACIWAYWLLSKPI